MAITRKEFVLQVVEELQKNPRATLAGHGIQAAVLQTIVSRPDVMSKLATVLYSTVYAKKGAAGLKKAPNFKITGYKNFSEFNLKAREDVENFVGGLTPEDSASFTNTDNVLTILLLAENDNTGIAESLTNQIVSGKSIALTFDSAVRKEYKVPGVMYLTIMLGASAARAGEAAIALRKIKVNKTRQSRRTPAKIMAELKSKASKKLNMLTAKRKELEQDAFTTSMELEQLSTIKGIYGGNTTDNRIIRERKKEIEEKIRALSSNNGVLLLKLHNDGVDDKKALSIKSMISKNNTAIRQYRAKLGTYASLSPNAMLKKSVLLKKTHQLIEANIAKGASISQALNNALASVGMKPKEQQIIKQQIMEQVASGMPMQYATQQAIQQNFVEPVGAGIDTGLSGNAAIADILNTL